MPKVITANRLADGIVVYAGRGGSWSERLSQAKIFASKAEAEAGLLIAQNDAKRNLVVEPVVVEVAEDAGGLRAVTLREIIRARGPTIDFLPRTHAFAHGADPPPASSAKQATKAVLRIPRLAATREHDSKMNSWLQRSFEMQPRDEGTHRKHERFDLKCSGYRGRFAPAEHG
jgi:Protein of unknown function (DUF2849)